MIWVFIAETFPARFRAICQAIGCGTHWVCAAMSLRLVLAFGFHAATYLVCRQRPRKNPHFVDETLEVRVVPRRKATDHEVEVARFHLPVAVERSGFGPVHEEAHGAAVERAGQMHPPAQGQWLGRREMVAPRGLRHREAGFSADHAEPKTRAFAAAEDAIDDPTVVLRGSVSPHPTVDRDRVTH